MRRAPGEEAATAVVGAILVLAVMSLSLVYVNAVYVPRQGASLEVDARDEAQASLLRLASDLSGDPAPLQRELPLRSERPLPPLLSGVILTPSRVEGSLAFEPRLTNVTVSHVVAANAPVDAADPMREDLGGGLMRVYDLGNRTAGHPVGTLDARVGGGYLEPATLRLEAGALLALREEGSSLAAAPSLEVARAGNDSAPTTRVAWRIPLLEGAAGEVSGGDAAAVRLDPGRVAIVGGGQPVLSVTIRVETGALTAWTAALEAAVGAHGSVVATATGADRGVVVATVLAPADAAPGVAAVELDLSAVRYQAQVLTR